VDNLVAKEDVEAPQAEAVEPSGSHSSPPFSHHVFERTIILPEQRVLFLPIPKAGCTTVLWLLAEVAGIPNETFARSALPEVSPALTVHDTSLWGEGRRLADYAGEELERVLTEDGWFRFTVVRHPGTRLWSAWQSKLLLREPRFVADFGEEPWFPRMAETPADLVVDFRRFVAALPGGTAEDVHWAVQHDLARQLPLTHVGRVEQLHETLALLQAQVSDERWPRETGRENRTKLPMPPDAYAGEAAAVLYERYRADFDQYGYEPERAPSDGGDSDWEERVAPLLPALRETIDKHARIGQLHRLADRRTRRVQALEERLESVASGRTGRASAPVLTNLEGETEYNVRWAWSEGGLLPGFTAVVRVKNEAESLPWVLPHLLRAVREVVVVDNGSTDGTAEVARRVASEAGAADRLDVRSYPFSVARCGQEHLDTPAESVHSLAYFYNWAFSHVRTGYALKWDGDMVLTDSAANVLRDLGWQLEAAEVVVKIPRYPLYVADDRRAFLDVGLSNREPWAWPNRPGYSFVKAMEWELPLWSDDVATMMLPDWSCLELKHLTDDEFAHWSPTDFEASGRTQRKRREWQVFHALVDGAEPPDHVVPVEAPEGVHVIDYARSTWLPAKADELPGFGERLIGRLAVTGI
jgi:hypothetical protein